MTLEKSASSNERGQQRRLVLIAVSRSADVLSNLSIEAPDAYAEMMELSELFLEHARGLVSVAESAIIRLKIADCREAA